MTRKLLAGTFSAVPIRVHVYPSRGAHMFVGADGMGCWSDPEGKVLLFSMDDVNRVANAHGYTVDPETNAVTPLRGAGATTPGDVDTSYTPSPASDLLGGESAAQPDVAVVQPEGVLPPEPEVHTDPLGALKVLEEGEGVAGVLTPGEVAEQAGLAPALETLPTPAPAPESTTRAKRTKKGK